MSDGATILAVQSRGKECKEGLCDCLIVFPSPLCSLWFQCFTWWSKEAPSLWQPRQILLKHCTDDCLSTTYSAS